MSERDEIDSVRLISAWALLVIIFWGEPDIADAIIHFLTEGEL